MDGVLVDTEHLWDDVREELTNEWGGRYTPAAQEAMMGMSSHEWSRYLHEVVGLREQPETINAEVVRRMLARYEDELPVVPGAVDAVRRLHREGLRLAVASSSNRELIDAVLRRLRLAALFGVTVSSEEVGRGKPAPDTFLAGARALGLEPQEAVVFEDALAGVEAGRAGGFLFVVGIDRTGQADALRKHGADIVVDDLAELLDHS